jgi:ubiquinone/menaquinone biosynthesis C-methylase UbiE
MVHTASAADLAAQSARYDLVTCLHVLEHLQDPLDVLVSMCRLARPGGLIYIELPNELDAWRSRVKRLFGRPASTPAGRARTGHRQCFSKTSISKLVRRAGCALMRIDTRDFIEPHSRFERRVVVHAANRFARTSLIQGNVLRCWCRAS